jgi:hypothetical protein
MSRPVALPLDDATRLGRCRPHILSTGKCILGGSAEGGAIRREQRTGKGGRSAAPVMRDVVEDLPEKHGGKAGMLAP